MDEAVGVADEAEAWLRSYGVGDRLGWFLRGELDPLIDACIERGQDPVAQVVLPMAALLRQTADRLEAAGNS